MKGPGISFSATSTVCMLLGWGILYKLLKLENINKLKRLIVVSIIFSGLFYLIVQVFQINVITILADMVGRDPDLTGRDIVWERLWPIAMRNPILGTGFGGFWIEPMWLADNRTINQAHNGYLDIFIMSGAVGLLLFFLYIIASLKKATTLFGYNKYWGSFVITMLLISLFHNFTESSYLMSTMFLWNIIVVNSIALSPNCTSYRT
jgi:O-antigen ligase